MSLNEEGRILSIETAHETHDSGGNQSPWDLNDFVVDVYV